MVSTLTKICGCCKLELPTSSFHKAKRERSGLQQWCKECRKAHKPEERKQYHKDRYHKEKDNYLNWTYLRHYGITLDTYNQMLQQQMGVCAICKLECNTGRRLSVDHCHDTGKVRGLLCGNCNKGIGSLRDSISLLKQAINYLENATNKTTV